MGLTKEERKRREELLKQGLKVCSTCKRELPFDMFTKDCTTKTGLSSLCKDCQHEQRIRRKDVIDKWFEENQDRVKEKQHEYSMVHAEEKRAYNQANKEYFKQKRKEYEAANPERVKEIRQKSRHSLSTRYKKYQLGAQERNLDFSLTIEDFDRITKMPCYYCGDLPEDKFGNKFTGIDRLDSSQGYIIDNVVPCCPICNRMKSNHDITDWLQHLLKIIDRMMEDEVIPRDFFNSSQAAV